MQNIEKMERINITIYKSVLKEVDEVAKMRLEDRSTAIRQLLFNALKEERIERSIQLYKQQKVTLRKAAELGGLNYWEFQNEMAKRGIPVISSLAQAEQRIKYVESKLKRK